jgi:hypothetical protein
MPEGMQGLKGRDRLSALPLLLAMNGAPVETDNVRIQSTSNDNGSTNYCMVTLNNNQYAKLDASVFDDSDLKISIVIEVPHLNGGYKKNNELSGDFIASLLANKR